MAKDYPPTPKNTGNLYRNTKPKGDTSPSWWGMSNICGVEYWVNVFIETDEETGKTYMECRANRQSEDTSTPESFTAKLFKVDNRNLRGTVDRTAIKITGAYRAAGPRGGKDKFMLAYTGDWPVVDEYAEPEESEDCVADDIPF